MIYKLLAPFLPAIWGANFQTPSPSTEIKTHPNVVMKSERLRNTHGVSVLPYTSLCPVKLETAVVFLGSRAPTSKRMDREDLCALGAC